jgi:hypothetical protein
MEKKRWVVGVIAGVATMTMLLFLMSSSLSISISISSSSSNSIKNSSVAVVSHQDSSSPTLAPTTAQLYRVYEGSYEYNSTIDYCFQDSGNPDQYCWSPWDYYPVGNKWQSGGDQLSRNCGQFCTNQRRVYIVQNMMIVFKQFWTSNTVNTVNLPMISRRDCNDCGKRLNADEMKKTLAGKEKQI